MPTSSQVFASVDNRSANVRITNHTAGTSETSHALISDLKQLIIRSRDVTATLQIAYTATESGTKYMTIRPHTVYEVMDLKFSGVTLYITADKTTVVEIQELY